ncbi:PIG-L deacetylase family protein [Prosthecomicrobium sp. N25]|uniref:PIG-L deacetylase family protein n=1 Tax=Prosthecomicrobium sp. N25 TaxID=3129254 RepID=UPI003076895F
MIASIQSLGRTLVIAPHPDDEILGCGGTMARLAEAGLPVYVAVVTEGRAPAFPPEQVARVKAEAARAHAHLGVRETLWLGQPAAQLSEHPHAALNAAIRKAVLDVAPDTLLIPHLGDIHIDHQLVFLSSLVAARPHQAEYPPRILAYETMSETNWNAPYLTPPFVPNVFVDIGAQLGRKLEAMALFESQVKQPPHERSVETLRALATLRGATVHRTAAEGFVLIRNVL